MSNTRRATPGKPLRQERFCSSPQLQRGLMANIVARRCETVERPEDRDLIWLLQLLSHQWPGGLKAFTRHFLERGAHRLGTPSMLRFGNRPGQFYDAKQVRAVRDEMDWGWRSDFYLQGESSISDLLNAQEREGRVSDDELNDLIVRDAFERKFGAGPKRHNHPEKYPASAFCETCRIAADTETEQALESLCLDPEASFERGPWFFSEMITSLREFQAAYIEQRRSETVVTELGRQVYETLDYALETRCMVLIEGLARTGKTHSAKAYCAEHPGRTRYVQVPSTNDETGFFRAIAKSLGVSINLNSKAQELRERILEVLQRGDLLLVLDEAHYLWPNLVDPRTLPARINWILTGLVNYDAPVALVTTPQFLTTQKMIEERTRWTSEQFIGRIGHYQKLPDGLPESDLANVAKALLPEGDARSIEILVRYAQSSAKYLAGIVAVVRRARYLAGKAGREKVTMADLKQAIKGSVIPSDSALATSLAEATQRGGKRGGRRRGRGSREEILVDSTPVYEPLLAGDEPLPFRGGQPAPEAAPREIFGRDRTQAMRDLIPA
jgi:hypothetical protein